MAKKRSIFSPMRTLFNSKNIGTINPSNIGIKQNVFANSAPLKLNFFGEILLNLFEVSLYF